MPEAEMLAGRYRLRSLIGRGAMGEVWLAEDELLNRTVAVKRLVSAPGVRDPVQVERVMREARLAGRLSHPNAVAVFDLLVSDGVPVVVMEYVDGDSLGTLVRRRGPLPPTEVARYGADVAAALEAAHRAGIVHRDVKPDNVLITPHGTAKLADFGIAHAAEEAALTQTGMTVGTPAYLAPEVARGGSPSPAGDLWSLGATLFAAVEGRPPFGAPTDNALAVVSKVVADPVPVPRRAGALAGTISRMLQRDPASRPSAVAARSMLAEVADRSQATTVFAPLVDGPATQRIEPASGVPPSRAPVAGTGAVGAAGLALHGRGPGPGRPRRSRVPLLATLLVAVILLAAAAVALSVLLGSGGGPTTPTPRVSVPAVSTAPPPTTSNPPPTTSTSSPATSTAATTASSTPSASATPTTSAPSTSAAPTTSAASSSASASVPAAAASVPAAAAATSVPVAASALPGVPAG